MKTLQRLPKTKEDIDTFVNTAIGEILSGNIDPLEAEVTLKIIEDSITKIRKDIRVRNVVMEEAEKYNGQIFMGATIKVGKRKTADYTGDTEWLVLKANLKGREALLKACSGVDPLSGEIVVTYKESETLTIKL